MVYQTLIGSKSARLNHDHLGSMSHINKTKVFPIHWNDYFVIMIIDGKHAQDFLFIQGSTSDSKNTFAQITYSQI